MICTYALTINTDVHRGFICKRKNLKITQICIIHEEEKSTIWSNPTMEHYLVKKRNELMIHTTLMDVKVMILSKRNQQIKNANCFHLWKSNKRDTGDEYRQCLPEGGAQAGLRELGVHWGFKHWGFMCFLSGPWWLFHRCMLLADQIVYFKCMLFIVCKLYLKKINYVFKCMDCWYEFLYPEFPLNQDNGDFYFLNC